MCIGVSRIDWRWGRGRGNIPKKHDFGNLSALLDMLNGEGGVKIKTLATKFLIFLFNLCICILPLFLIRRGRGLGCSAILHPPPPQSTLHFTSVDIRVNYELLYVLFSVIF